ncbi:hypothetical protein T4D_4917 [Trichinella pseudospiralis]|uniref:Uncharacterized protein n=1 Tax=Trichinella pseudospiralis TaxID=6337 RepID=A0A0V1ER39_TRIPS|nr:hypothetical protein T4D_4917 [Trichinella pseudospiralis]
MLQEHASCQSDWCDKLTQKDNADLLDKLPCFKLLDLVGQRT